MPEENKFLINYSVKVTKAARRQGKQLKLSPEVKYELIVEMKELKYWDQNSSEYDYEEAFGAIEFKYQRERKWIRIIVFKDDDRRIMWVIRVFSKKNNQILDVDKIGIETAVRRLKREIMEYKKQQKLEEKKQKLKLLSKGEKHE